MITGVAIIDEDGRMVALPRPCRHHHIYALAAFMGLDMEHATRQGFICDDGMFLDRQDALFHVKKCGQPTRRELKPGDDELYSEDLW